MFGLCLVCIYSYLGSLNLMLMNLEVGGRLENRAENEMI